METDQSTEVSAAGGRIDRNWIAISAGLVGLVVVAGSLKRFLRNPIRKFRAQVGARIENRFAANYDQRMRSKKSRLFDGLHCMAKELGRPVVVVEIGSGNGVNFPYYPAGTKVIAVDPNPYWSEYLSENCAMNPHIHLDHFHVGYAENMKKVDSNSADAVVGSLVMCSVRSVDKSLSEVLRILKPGGKYFFLEHVIAEKGTRTYYAQHLFNGLWRQMSHCSITRKTFDSIRNAGFSHVDLELFEADELVQPAPVKPMGPLIYLGMRHAMGVATK
jgi:ubiquinone/menaquinone biosynthesis C-methylase UbiE